MTSEDLCKLLFCLFFLCVSNNQCVSKQQPRATGATKRPILPIAEMEIIYLFFDIRKGSLENCFLFGRGITPKNVLLEENRYP